MRFFVLGLVLLHGCASKDEDGDGVSAADDCDDGDATIGAPGPAFTDGDGDGFGGAEQAAACPGAGVVAEGGDCDDAEPATNPNGTEVCNGVDDNCDGSIDESGGSDVWLDDLDGDGFGDTYSALVRCEAAGLTQQSGDCDDGNPDVYPGQTEICNGVDDDCDNVADDGAVDATSWYGDVDGDGYGTDGVSLTACDPPPGYADVGGDCDDGDDAQNPGALEVCDGVDNDCDGVVDEDLAVPHYLDTDGDGWGSEADGKVLVCEGVAPVGYVALSGDCDEADPAVHPDAVDGCNGIDDDCDGGIDEDLTFVTIYPDVDGDGFGDDLGATEDCSGAVPDGWTLTPGDCDDDESLANPDEVEACDRIDNDCDGDTDEDFTVYTIYADDDVDGWGDVATSMSTCADEVGWSDTPGDCDDADPTTYPGAPESCDLRDNDCDVIVDEDLVFSSWYGDADGDSWGVDTDIVVDCAAPPGYAVRDGDCDDAERLIYPTAAERCNGLDDNCDGAVPADEVDADGDGYPSCDDPDNADPLTPGCAFASASYAASVTFVDTLPTTSMTLAWDGTSYWSSSGGSSAGDRLAEYAADGTHLANYSPGRDLRSVFTIGDGIPPTFIRSYGSPRIEVETSPGSYTGYVTLVGGSLDSQSSVVWNEEFERFAAFLEPTISLWDASGATMPAIRLVGYGSMGLESDYPQDRGVATSGRCFLTYDSGNLSAWDEDGVRTDTTVLTGAGTTFDSYFSLSYANGMVWILDAAGGSWRGFDVGF